MANSDRGVTCAYCGAIVLNAGEYVPPVDDDKAWDDLEGQHEPDCEWVITRAHRLCGDKPVTS